MNEEVFPFHLFAEAAIETCSENYQESCDKLIELVHATDFASGDLGKGSLILPFKKSALNSALNWIIKFKGEAMNYPPKISSADVDFPISLKFEILESAVQRVQKYPGLQGFRLEVGAIFEKELLALKKELSTFFVWQFSQDHTGEESKATNSQSGLINKLIGDFLAEGLLYFLFPKKAERFEPAELQNLAAYILIIERFIGFWHSERSNLNL